MPIEAKTRVGRWTGIPEVIRIMSSQTECEVCSRKYGTLTDGLTLLTQNLDHILPRRLLAHWKMNCHDRINIISLCGPCHAKKKKAEDCLFESDVYTYLRELNRLGWPMSYVWRALRQYHLDEPLKLFRSESELL